jgi:hypothetical protein
MISAEIRLVNPQSLSSQAEYEKANNLATYNVDNCANLLKKTYNIQSDIVVARIEKNSNLRLDNVNNPYPTNSILVNFYNPISFKKLNSSVCDTSITFGLPIKDPSRINMTKYKLLKDNGIDMYDSNDEGFNSICKPVVDKDTNSDTSLDYRRTNYYEGMDALCAGGCSYIGIDDTDRLLCSCNGLNSNFEYQGDFKYNKNPFVAVTVNQQIIGCVSAIGV